MDGETIRITEENQHHHSSVTAYLPDDDHTKQTVTFGNINHTRMQMGGQARTETISMKHSEMINFLEPNVVAVINEDHRGRSPSRETVKSHQKQRRGQTI